MVAGFLLATLKISVGWLAGSLAVVADGVESAGDMVASMILWAGLTLAVRPADADHPYGHGRFEILAGQAIGAVLISSGSLLGWHSVHRLAEPQKTPESFAIWTLVISIAVKLGLAQWKRRAAMKLKSAALEADAWNDWLDVLSGGIAIIALGLNLWRPVQFGYADSLGGLLVAALVVFLGLSVLRDSSWQLVDSMPSPEMLAAIERVAMQVPGALGIEKCLARKTGFQYHVDLHLEVDPAISVEKAHVISGRVRSAIREKIDWVADVLIHVEPQPRDTKERISNG